MDGCLPVGFTLLEADSAKLICFPTVTAAPGFMDGDGLSALFGRFVWLRIVAIDVAQFSPCYMAPVEIGSYELHVGNLYLMRVVALHPRSRLARVLP